MSKLEKAIYSLHALAHPGTRLKIGAGWMLLITLVYIIAVLSVPLYAPQWLVWMAVYPVLMSEAAGLGFARIFLKSLWILPIVIMVGVFNPIYDTAPALTIAGITVSQGWISFLSIVLRGLLAFQAAIIMTRVAGFLDICRVLRRVRVPYVLIIQMEMTYRYMIVIAEEALDMDRARKARGFGRRSYPLAMWGRMIGQLLIRSYDRASRIHRAMLARGM